MEQRDLDIDLLYVEDNEDFIEFMDVAMRKLGVQINYQFVTDGTAAKELLENTAQLGSPAKVKLVLLDYNLPGMSSMQLLKYMRSTASMKHIPVVMFSSSDNPQDIKRAYSHGANAYLVKPVGMENLKSTVQTMYDFWINKNQLSN